MMPTHVNKWEVTSIRRRALSPPLNQIRQQEETKMEKENDFRTTTITPFMGLPINGANVTRISTVIISIPSAPQISVISPILHNRINQVGAIDPPTPS